MKTKRLIASERDPDPVGGAILAVAFSPDGTTLATADLDGSTYVWGTPAGGNLSNPKGT
jgi:WD40 repeat protein